MIVKKAAWTRTALLLLGGLFALVPAYADLTPRPFTAVYQLTRAGFPIGQLRMSLTPQGGNRYIYEAVTRTTGVVALLAQDKLVEYTLMSFDNGRIRPLEYEYHHTGGKKERHVSVRFDWDNGIAENSVGDQSWRLAVTPGTLDKHVYLYALMIDLQNSRTDLEYPIADGGRLKKYRFSLLGKKRLDTALGMLDVLGVKRVRKNKEAAIFWCAPELGYLPARIERQDEKGRRVALSLQSVNGEGIPPKYNTAAAD